MHRGLETEMVADGLIWQNKYDKAQGLQGALKGLATRFYQLASGHAMTDPFPKERFG